MKSQNQNALTAIWVSVFLAIATLAVFSPVRQNDFVNYDDPIYLTDNPNVQSGLTAHNISWAFTTTYANFWHPLTWLSHMLDCQIFGLNPGGHHLVGMLWHAANTVLLFLVLRRMTGALWRSAFVAALFSLHPLHVESVAWASERKDLLSTFFGLLSLWAYARFTNYELRITSQQAGNSSIVNRKSKIYYAMALLFFALGLIAKPMLVTLPFVFLLMDVWPLQRVTPDLWRVAREESRHWSLVTRHLIEKIPFFALAAIAGFLAFRAQEQGGAITPLSSISLVERIKNMFVSYWTYLGKTFVPTKLAIHYPYEDWSWGLVAVSAVALLIFCGVTLWSLRRWPYIFTGCLWFLGTLFPVIGFVQVGNFSMADRFTYFPLIGIFIALTWAVHALTANWKNQSTILGGGAFVTLSACVFLTTDQIHYWQNTETVFTHAVEAQPRDFLSHYNLARQLVDLGKIDEGLEHYQRVLDLNPGSTEAHNNLAGIYLAQGKADLAVSHLSAAAALQPNNAEVQFNYAVALASQGRTLEAVEQYRMCLKINPEHIGALHNLAWHLATASDDTVRNGMEALELAQKACQLSKFSDPRCLDSLDAAYAELGRFTEAQAVANQALRLASTSREEKLEKAAAKRMMRYQQNQPYRAD